MKKLWISVTAIIFLVAAYVVADNILLEESIISADHQIFKNLDDAIASSDLVVIAKVEGNSKNILEENDGFIDGYTLTDINISQIIEKNIDQDIQLNETITIAEPAFVVDKGGLMPGKLNVTYEDYTRLKTGSEYVLFLKYQKRTGVYWVNSLEQGKYNLDDTDKDEVIATEQLNSWNIIKKELVQKYSSKIKEVQ